MPVTKKTTITAEPGQLDITITREFDAPRELVFKAHTVGEMYCQWLGPRRLKMTLPKFEPWDGGSYRFIHTDEDGTEYGFHGVYHEVLAPERIINTFEFEGMPERGHVVLQTARFEPLPGNRTRLIGQAVFQSVEDRDGMLEPGAEAGVSEGFEKLDELLARLK